VERWTSRTLSPLPPLEPDTTNAFAEDDQAAALGQRLFFEKGYSGPIKVGDDGTNGGLGAVGETGKVSCASCHLPDDWFIDTRSNPGNTPLAIDWYIRNTPTLVNVATYSEQFGWSGFNDNLWGKNLVPAEFVMGADRSSIVHFLYASYRAD
jgi:cytochrome c peroxidase